MASQALEPIMVRNPEIQIQLESENCPHKLKQNFMKFENLTLKIVRELTVKLN